MVNSQDELDKRILDTMLSGKGISPRLSDLARELSRPRSTIDLRVRLLEDEKIIEGYRPVINWEKLGYEIEGYVGVSCSEESVPALLESIKDSDCCSVESVFEVTTGMFDIFAKCRFRNYEEIKELRKLIRVMDEVKEVEVFLLVPATRLIVNKTIVQERKGNGKKGYGRRPVVRVLVYAQPKGILGNEPPEMHLRQNPEVARALGIEDGIPDLTTIGRWRERLGPVAREAFEKLAGVVAMLVPPELLVVDSTPLEDWGDPEAGRGWLTHSPYARHIA